MNLETKEEQINIIQNIFNDKWKIKIICSLLNKERRLKDLNKVINNITQKTLIVKLKELEKKGLVEKRYFPEVPPKVVYSVTPVGKKLKPIIFSMLTWVDKYKINFISKI